ncbi:MAG: hypothetical protein ACREGK_03575 [Geminicoccales bacterium]
MVLHVRQFARLRDARHAFPPLALVARTLKANNPRFAIRQTPP